MPAVECFMEPRPRAQVNRESLAAQTELLLHDRPALQALTSLCELAGRLFRAPVAFIARTSPERELVLCTSGFDMAGCGVEFALAETAFDENDCLCVADALHDARFHRSSWVTGPPHLRFLAAARIAIADRHFGSLVIMDGVPREFPEPEREVLRSLAHRIEDQLELSWRRRAMTPSELAQADAGNSIGRADKSVRDLIDGLGPSLFVALLTPDGTVLEASRSALAASGQSAAEVIGTRLHLLPVWQATPDGPEELRAAVALAANNTTVRYTSRARVAGDQLLDLDLCLQPLCDEAGLVTGVVASASDITESTRAQLRIQHLNRVHAMLSAVNQTIVRQTEPSTMLDEACRIAVEKGRFRLALIVARHDTKLHITAHAGGESDASTRVRAVLENPGTCRELAVSVAHSGQRVVCNDIALDERAASFRLDALESGYQAIASLPLSAAERLLGSFTLCATEPEFFDAEELSLLAELARNIAFALEVHEGEAERRAVELRLRESEARFREFAETIHEVFWITDPVSHTVHYISPAYEKIWGRSVEEIYRSPMAWAEAIHADDRERVLAGIQAAAATGVEYDEHFRITRPDGTQRFIHDRGFAIRDDAGKVVRLLGAAEDITKARQIEEQLRQAQKMEAIGQLAGGVAHDFNNVLTVIQGYGSLLLEEEDATEAKLAAREIVRAAERAAQLTRQLLVFSRRQVIETRVLDLNQVVASLTSMLERILGEDVQLELCLNTEHLFIRADAGMLDQVLLNLVVNARDAMPDGGRLTITTERQVLTHDDVASLSDATAGPHVCLSVADTGSGILPEHLPRIFEPFFSTKGPEKGSGLGLATVFGIVKQHAGLLTVESVSGHGSTFHILLPEVPVPAHHDAGERPRSGPRGGNETILLVEDDPRVRLLTRVVLERVGYQVIEADNGPNALGLWDQHQETTKLLFTDIVMPGGLSGRELAARLRERNPGLKVVFTSGYSDDIAGHELSLGAGQTFIQKPASPREILETVRSCLDS